MEFLPLQHELVLSWFGNENLLPPKPTLDDLHNFQEKNYTFVDKVEIFPIVYALLKEEYLGKFNPNFSLEENPRIFDFKDDDIFFITLKGRKYLENSKIEKRKIDIAEDSNKKADRALLQSKISNVIAFFALIISLCLFFKK